MIPKSENIWPVWVVPFSKEAVRGVNEDKIHSLDDVSITVC